MNHDSDNESIEGEVDVDKRGAEWGKAKYDYYYTDYVDKDYPNKLSAKEERLAAIEQEEALRIQKKLLSTLDNIVDLGALVDTEDDENSSQVDLIDLIETQNKNLESQKNVNDVKSKKRKGVQFLEEQGSDECEFNESDNEVVGDDDVSDDAEREAQGSNTSDNNSRRQRRPIDIAIKKNRGLTPYKKKEYRNPRVKHKLKFEKAMSKRRRLVKEAQSEFHRYTGEATGIKTSTIKSIKLC